MWVSSNHPMVAFSKGEEGVWPCSGVYWGDVKVGDVGREGVRVWKGFYGVLAVHMFGTCWEL